MEKRCFACMNKIDADVCRHCSNDNSDLSKYSKGQLNPGTIIKDRYYVGYAIEQNGEGITYIAYDNVDKKKVRVREFYPSNLCYRQKDGNTVTVNTGYEIQYKSLMTDFAELSKQLISLKSNNSLLKAETIFSSNDTLYVIYEDIEGTSLTKYLVDNAGELSWEETENLFLPLLYTVKLLNSNGIIHRGISPETILVTKQNELKLLGVCTSGVRAINSDIKPELFIGYAAPEQYQKCTSYGEWTDVYSISAVLYKTLTGTMPPRADFRDVNNNLITPNQLNPSVPKQVSDAIAKGLAYEKEQRTLYIKDLIGALYSSQQMTTESVYDKSTKSKKKKFKMPVWLIVVLVMLPIMLFFFFGIYYLVLGPKDNSKDNTSSLVSSASSEINTSSEVSSKESSSETPSSKITSVSVDSFMDKVYDNVIASPTYSKMFKFKKIEEYSNIIEIGIVMKQSIEPNTVVEEGKEIELTVSKGVRYVPLPPITDNEERPISPEDYQKELKNRGIESVIEKIDSSDVASGQIVKLSEPLRALVDRETVKSITIYVAN